MPSAARDRTQEFLATISTFQQFNKIETLNVSVSDKNSDTSQQYIEQSHRIHNLTLEVDANINDVSQKKLKKIEQLAKVSNNLNDRQSEINELIVDVNEDLHKIDENIFCLETFISQLDYDNNQNCACHHKALLRQLISKNEILKSLYRSTHNIAVDSLKKQKKQRDKYPAIVRPKRALNRRNEYKKQIGNQSIQRQMQIHDTLNIVNYQGLRLDAVSEMVQQITDINDMTIDLAVMVEHQGETIRIIDENVIKANENMDGVIGELQKYLAKMTANEMLMLKVFALIIFLAIFFAIFIA